MRTRMKFDTHELQWLVLGLICNNSYVLGQADPDKLEQLKDKITELNNLCNKENQYQITIEIDEA